MERAPGTRSENVPGIENVAGKSSPWSVSPGTSVFTGTQERCAVTLILTVAALLVRVLSPRPLAPLTPCLSVAGKLAEYGAASPSSAIDHLLHQFPRDQTGQSSQPKYFKNKVCIRHLAQASCTGNMGWFQYCWGMKDGRQMSTNAMVLSKWTIFFFIEQFSHCSSSGFNFRVTKNQFCLSLPVYGYFSGGTESLSALFYHILWHHSRYCLWFTLLGRGRVSTVSEVSIWPFLLWLCFHNRSVVQYMIVVTNNCISSN